MQKIKVLCFMLSSIFVSLAQASPPKAIDPWLLVDRALQARLADSTEVIRKYLSSIQAAEKTLQNSTLDIDTRKQLPKIVEAYVQEKIPEQSAPNFQQDLQAFVDDQHALAQNLELGLGDLEQSTSPSFNPNIDELKVLIGAELAKLEKINAAEEQQLQARLIRLVFLFLRISKKEDRLTLLGKSAELAALIELRLNLREKAAEALGLSAALIDPAFNADARPPMPKYADFDFYSLLEKFYRVRRDVFDDPQVKDLSLNGFFVQVKQLEAEARNWEVSKIPGAPGEEASVFVNSAPTVIEAYASMHLEAIDVLKRDLKLGDYAFFSSEAKAIAEELPKRELSYEKLQVAVDPISGEAKQQPLTDIDAIEYYRFLYRARFFVFLLTHARYTIEQQVVRMAPHMQIYKDLGDSLGLLLKALSKDSGLPMRIFWIPQDAKRPF